MFRFKDGAKTLQGITLNLGTGLTLTEASDGTPSLAVDASAGLVTSVFGRIGNVTAQASDYSSFYGLLGSNNSWSGGNYINAVVAGGTVLDAVNTSATGYGTFLKGGASAAGGNYMLRVQPYNASYTALLLDGSGLTLNNDLYVNSGWLRTYGQTGIYSQTYDTYLYHRGSKYIAFANRSSTGGGTGHFAFLDGYEGTYKGAVYWDSTGFGLLASDSNWAFRVTAGGDAAVIRDLSVGRNLGVTSQIVVGANGVQFTSGASTGPSIQYGNSYYTNHVSNHTTTSSMRMFSSTLTDLGWFYANTSAIGLLNAFGDWSLQAWRSSSYGGAMYGQWLIAPTTSYSAVGSEMLVVRKDFSSTTPFNNVLARFTSVGSGQDATINLSDSSVQDHFISGQGGIFRFKATGGANPAMSITAGGSFYAAGSQPTFAGGDELYGFGVGSNFKFDGTNSSYFFNNHTGIVLTTHDNYGGVRIYGNAYPAISNGSLVATFRVAATVLQSNEVILAGAATMTSGWGRTAIFTAAFPVAVFNSNNSKYAGIGYDYSVGTYGIMRWWLGASSANVLGGGSIQAMTLGDAGLGVATRVSVSSTGTSQFVMNSSGTYYGVIANPSAQVWQLGHSSDGATMTGWALRWEPNGTVTTAWDVSVGRNVTATDFILA